MKMHAYQEIYLSNTQSKLAEAFDYSVNACQISGEDFSKMFVVSSFSKQMEKGNPAYVGGRSGIEIALEVIFEIQGFRMEPQKYENYVRSKEYWIGWAVAYYQWYSDRSFQDIFTAVSYRDLEIMYQTLHEADITKFVDIMDTQMKKYFPDTNLKRIRKIHNITQKELAERSSVGLRSIQMYEQRSKNINNASGETLYRLSKVLSCRMEDLLEK